MVGKDAGFEEEREKEMGWGAVEVEKPTTLGWTHPCNPLNLSTPEVFRSQGTYLRERHCTRQR